MRRRAKQRKESLCDKNRMEETCVEEIGNMGWRYGSYRCARVVERWNYNKGLERDVMRTSAFEGMLWRLEIISQAFYRVPGGN
jgi:NADPH-dependent 7-cyano-7-deazaguanine reductase QueF